jgi:hypothetical protein
MSDVGIGFTYGAGVYEAVIILFIVGFIPGFYTTYILLKRKRLHPLLRLFSSLCVGIFAGSVVSLSIVGSCALTHKNVQFCRICCPFASSAGITNSRAFDTFRVQSPNFAIERVHESCSSLCIDQFSRPCWFLGPSDTIMGQNGHLMVKSISRGKKIQQCVA